MKMGREIFVTARKEQNKNTLALGHSEVDLNLFIFQCLGIEWKDFHFRRWVHSARSGEAKPLEHRSQCTHPFFDLSNSVSQPPKEVSTKASLQHVIS
jgi:hypothetical protein